MILETVARVKLLGLSGSLRSNSYSRSVLYALQRALVPEVFLAVRDLGLPLYNEDEDGDFASDDVRSFRSSIAASDGVVIITPEYNHGIPGVLKNALDWASRPLNSSALAAKPVVVMSVSPAFTGGVRAQASVHELCWRWEPASSAGPRSSLETSQKKSCAASLWTGAPFLSRSAGSAKWCRISGALNLRGLSTSLPRPCLPCRCEWLARRQRTKSGYINDGRPQDFDGAV